MYRGERGIVSYSKICRRKNHSVLHHHFHKLVVSSLTWYYITKGGKQWEVSLSFHAQEQVKIKSAQEDIISQKANDVMESSPGTGDRQCELISHTPRQHPPAQWLAKYSKQKEGSRGWCQVTPNYLLIFKQFLTVSHFYSRDPGNSDSK
jgi:hypothetical protein